MKKLKKIVFFILLLVFFLINTDYLKAQEVQENSKIEQNINIDKKQNNPTIYFFWGDGCPHCKKEEIFLTELKKKYPDIVIKHYEVWYNKENGKILQNIAKKLNINVSGVPFTIIGSKTISGYFDDKTTGLEIENQIVYCLENKCEDKVNNLIKIDEENNSKKEENIKNITNSKSSQKITFPFFGEIDLKNLSLPVIAILIGTLDGFNPCAMWILIFLISMLIGMENRKKMWILGWAFILSSAIVYFFFMTAWLNIILFFGFLFWIRFGIGVFSIAGGSYNLWQFYKTKDDGCNVVEKEKRKKIFNEIRKILHKKSFLLALVGICILAVGVNIIELLCSAGLPVVFTQILAINNLSNLEYYFYIILYVFFFMIDDLFVFIVSMVTLQSTGITTKYTKYSHLIGGILMLIIGILLIFKPNVLMFG